MRNSIWSLISLQELPRGEMDLKNVQQPACGAFARYKNALCSDVLSSMSRAGLRAHEKSKF